MNFNEKIFIITGASSGIGKALSKELAANGAIIVCTSRNKDKLDIVRDEIIASGGKSISIQTDVTDINQCIEMKNKVLKEYGRIDAIVLNAGVSMWAKFDEIENVDFFKDIMDVNFHGAVNCVHAVIREIKKTKGKIISCSSGQALMGVPNHSGYVASKHALHGFLSTIALENKKQLSVLELVLSWIKGTNLRNNSFNESGSQRLKSDRKHSNEALSLDKCIELIIKAIKNDKSVAYIPSKLSLIPFLKLFFNKFLESLIIKKVKENKSNLIK